MPSELQLAVFGHLGQPDILSLMATSKELLGRTAAWTTELKLRRRFVCKPEALGRRLARLRQLETITLGCADVYGPLIQAIRAHQCSDTLQKLEMPCELPVFLLGLALALSHQPTLLPALRVLDIPGWGNRTLGGCLLPDTVGVALREMMRARRAAGCAPFERFPINSFRGQEHLRITEACYPYLREIITRRQTVMSLLGRLMEREAAHAEVVVFKEGCRASTAAQFMAGVGAGRLPKVKVLRLFGVPLEGAAMGNLALAVRDGHCPHLEELALNACSVLAGDLAGLADALQVQRAQALTRLSLKLKGSDDEDLVALREALQAGSFPSLARLELAPDGQNATRSIVEMLRIAGGSSAASNVRELVLRQLCLSEEAAVALGRSLGSDNWPLLDTFCMSDIQQYGAVDRCIAQEHFISALEQLASEGRGMTARCIEFDFIPGSVEALASMLQNRALPRLETLGLNKNGFVEGDAQTLVDTFVSFDCAQIKALRLCISIHDVVVLRELATLCSNPGFLPDLKTLTLKSLHAGIRLSSGIRLSFDIIMECFQREGVVVVMDDV